MTTTDPLSLAYLVHCEAEHVSANTIKARRRVLDSIGCAGEADRETVELWWRSRAELSPATRANDLACLRSFYRWCQRWEYRADDPTLRLDAPKQDKGLPRPFSRADVDLLLDRERGVPDDELRRAIVLGAYAGLRVSEAAGADWRDYDDERRRLRVTGKGGKTREVPLSQFTLDLLVVPGVSRGTRYCSNIVTASDRAISAGVLQRRVNRAIQAAGVEGTFHRLRHRYATVALGSTGDLLAVSRALGHASPATTAVYAQTSDEVYDRIAEAVTR